MLEGMLEEPVGESVPVVANPVGDSVGGCSW